MGASGLQPALKIIQKIFIYSILNKITTMKNPKYIKLFEEWCPNLGYNESEKEQLKTDYEKFVMSKDYIPNMIRDLLKKHLKGKFSDFEPGNPFAIEIRWEPVTFEELKLKNNIPNKKKEFYDVCFAGILTLNAPFARHYDRTDGGGFNDQRLVLSERFDKILAEATKLLPLDLPVPNNKPDYWIKNPKVCDTSHGPKTFIELDNTYTLNQQYDDSYSRSTKYKASFALALDKVYLEI
jgi:hypothetical protein